MNNELMELFCNLLDKDDNIRYPAYQKVSAITEQKVDWAYEVWEQLLEMLKSENSYQRTIAARLLCNLSQSDGEKRIAAIVPEILVHTKDEKFITSRQILQVVWKIAWYQPDLCPAIVDHLKARFSECAGEKHANLLRQDILQSLITLAELRHDDSLFELVKQLIESESDSKNQKTYRGLMKTGG
jgi:HEAT repeat protein